jgi:glycosyltransferase involved in cell wall biosynthesis
VQLCTIIARNYLAYARVLAESLAEHQPDGRLAVLVVDGADDLRGEEESFEVLSPTDIGCDEFAGMAARYELVELATALKPWLLRFLLGRGAPSVTYLDPDIQVFDSLSRLEQLGSERGLVLIPHNTVPIPSDGLRPSQMMIVQAGVFNLGYVTLGACRQTERLLDWWSDRLLHECRVDPANGYFVDQRWMDLVPGLVSDYAVVRDPEFNLAYWNLHAHELCWDGRRYTVDGRPLAFFHFSGFDPDDPDGLSRHQSRIRTEDHPAVARICREYAAALRAHGHGMTRSLAYGYGRLSDGTPWDGLLRGLFQLGEQRQELGRSPFEPGGEEEFRTWLTSQDSGEPEGINRALAWLYRERLDLRQAFPDLEGADRSAYLNWARDHAPAHGFPPWFAPPRRKAEADGPDREVIPLGAPVAGVNVVGYFASELGVGEAARQLVRGLDSVDVPVLPLHGPTTPLSRQRHSFAFLDHHAARYPLNLICTNADVLPEFASLAGDSFFSGRYSIGVWFWEVTSAPPGEWREAFSVLDEVWAPSDHVARAIAAVAPIPTTRITIPVEVPEPPPIPRETFGLGAEEFAFLFSFDYLSVFERKNPLAVVQAFRAAFARDSGASLTIKTINHEHDPVARARLHATIANDPEIRAIERYLDPEAKDALAAACDCYVSLHRSEGFGLTMAEAMYLGKPVIATGYSGNLDFMTPHNSYLVDYELVPVGEGAAPYPAYAEWADPSIEHAAFLMRHVFEHREEARAKGQRAAADIRHSHSARRAGQVMRDRLARVQAPASEHDALLDRLADRVSAGPRDRTHRHFARRLLRSLLLRLMKPFSAFQRDVNSETVEVLRDLAQQLEAVRAEQLRAESERLRQARNGARASELRPWSPPAPERIDELAVAVERTAIPDVAPTLHARNGTREPERPANGSGEDDILVTRNLLDAAMAIGDTNGHGNGTH